MADPYDLQRFVDAQEEVMARVLDELKSGRKSSHWMWFVFPQIQGLGSSSMARRYAVGSLAEAEAYLSHATLGSRLRRCTELVNGVFGRTAFEIFGSPDDMKFRSSMTLFSRAAPGEDLFVEALARYFDALPDPATLARLDTGF